MFLVPEVGRFMVFVFFMIEIRLIGVLELFSDVGVEEGMLFPLNVLSFDDFGQTGVFAFSGGVLAFVFKIGFGMRRGFAFLSEGGFVLFRTNLFFEGCDLFEQLLVF